MSSSAPPVVLLSRFVLVSGKPGELCSIAGSESMTVGGQSGLVGSYSPPLHFLSISATGAGLGTISNGAQAGSYSFSLLTGSGGLEGKYSDVSGTIGDSCS